MKLKYRMSLFATFVGLTYSLSLNAQVLDKSWKEIINQKDQAWFASDEAKRIADNVLLYQRDIGGWPKNEQMQETISEEYKHELLALKPIAEGSTTDNGATTQEMLFLSKMYAQTKNDAYKESFLKGLNYLLEAQYNNGGWPQFYPLRKGYYSHITYNDDSMVLIMKALQELKNKTGYYSIEPSESTLKKINNAFEKGIDCILKTQYKQQGVLTGWCAQHDTLTFQPAKARTYELPSLSGHESAKIVLLLMSIDNLSPEVIKSIESAVAWFEASKIEGLREDRIYNSQGKPIEKTMVPDPSAPPIWARFMELEDNTPFFCDRDGIKKSSIEDIGEERRLGYAWYKDTPSQVLKKYPEWVKKNSNSEVLIEENLFEITVAKDGSGDYTSIQKAINNAKAFPEKTITIHVKNGIYKEKVKIHEWNPNLVIIGESKENTIITYDDYFNKIGLGRNSTFYTYTLLVEANNVKLQNLTIENSSGEVGQAVALSVFSDEVAVINCNIIGNQDTLYASGIGKQYYKDCYIEGTTDFIFGSATAFFEDCVIHSKKNSYITAASTPKNAKFGYVFKNCKLTADEGVNEVYLGRPWRNYAQTVFIHCNLDNHVLPVGWHNWSKPEAEKTSFYAESDNYGPGFQPEHRVKWSHQLKPNQAKKYTVKNILGKYKKTSKQEWYETF
jgi:pectinesterase